MKKDINYTNSVVGYMVKAHEGQQEDGVKEKVFCFNTHNRYPFFGVPACQAKTQIVGFS